MKKVLILTSFFLPLLSFAFTVPERPTGFVQDYAKLFTVEQVANLESKISNFEKNTTNEISVVIIPSLDGDTVENVAQEIFTKWGIGKKDKNNGILLLISIAERRTRIHTGYGVEGDLTDIGTSYIQSDIIAPAFRNGDYIGGINGAVDKMIEALGGNSIVPEGYSVSEKSRTDWKYIFVTSFILLQWIGSMLCRSKSWWVGGVLGGILGTVIWFLGLFSSVLSIVLFVFFVIFGLGFDYFVSKTYQNVKKTGGHYPWWIGGGGSSGGGFGGFGGGFSGGGGSSGRW